MRAVTSSLSSLQTYPRSHVKPLFSTHRLALNTTFIIIIWGFVLAFICKSAHSPCHQPHRNRLPPLHLLSPPLSRIAWFLLGPLEPLRHLPQLRHRLRPRHSRLADRVLRRRSDAGYGHVHGGRPQVFVGGVYALVGHLHVFVHDEQDAGVGAGVFVCEWSRAVRPVFVSMFLFFTRAHPPLQERGKSHRRGKYETACSPPPFGNRCTASSTPTPPRPSLDPTAAQATPSVQASTALAGLSPRSSRLPRRPRRARCLRILRMGAWSLIDARRRNVDGDGTDGDRPVFVSAALFMVSALLTLFLPIEVRVVLVPGRCSRYLMGGFQTAGRGAL